jgi:RNA polymerase sigma-70 factor (ECF subfamily)
VLGRDAATLILEQTPRVWEAGADGPEAGSGEVDPAVLAAAQRGDREAFIGVLRHYERRLRGIAFHHLQDQQLMEDVLQEVAIRAYRGLPAFRRESSVGTWLCRLTYNTCVDVHRRRRPDEPIAPQSVALVPGADSDPADAIAERDLVMQALAGLTPEQRLAVLLVDREGFDYASAAEILGVPVGTLASRLNRARAQLRVRLASAADQGARS